MAALLIAAAAAVFARPQGVGSEAQAAAAAPGAISGVVLEATTETPVAAAMVSIAGQSADGHSVRHERMADPQGRFVFGDLPPAALYRLFARKPGYTSTMFGEGRTSAQSVTLTSGQWAADVRVFLHRHGSISGRVVDEGAQPMTGVLVRAVARIVVGSRPQYVLGLRGQTDDRGIYRIANLPPGNYLVIAAPASADDLNVEPNPLVDPTTRRTYAAAFYPGVRDAAMATPVTLAASEHRLNVDFVLEPVRVGAIEGRLAGSIDGLPGTWLRLVHSAGVDVGFGYESAVAVVESDGTFAFPSVPAGHYVIESVPGHVEVRFGGASDQGPIAPPNAAMYGHRPGGGTTFGSNAGDVSISYTRRAEGGWIRSPVEVVADRTGHVVVPVRPTVSISGRVVIDDGPMSSAAGAARMPLSFFYAEPVDLSLGLTTARLDPDRPDVLTIRGLLPGEYYLTSASGRFSVKSIIWNGRDYADAPFDTSAAHDFQDVVVTLTSRRSTIEGTIRDAAGNPVPSATIIAFPADRRLWNAYGLRARRLGTVAAEAGGFTIAGLQQLTWLPAGEYLLTAVRQAPSDWSSETFLDAAARVATKVTVDWGETQRVDLRLQDVVVR